MTADEPWLGAVERVLLSSEPFAFGAHHAEPRRRCARRRGCVASTASCSAGTASRAVAGLRYLRALADDDNAAPRASA